MKKKTKEEFINQAKFIHGDKFDYSKINYINSKTKVEIICNACGRSFTQQPTSHLMGHGCPYCARQKVDYEDFLERAKLAHGDKYDYSKVDFENMYYKKIRITCPAHGDFLQRAANHAKGEGCPKCSKNFKLDTEAFIVRARETHGDKYDYSKVEYKSTEKKICIVCPEHGEFWQTPHDHLGGHGCASCAGSKKLTTEDFITRARKIHGNRYDYSKVDYKNLKEKVCIICSEHGEFWQAPKDHLDGCGCKKCNLSEMAAALPEQRKEIFLRRSREIHGDKYDYSKADYKSSKEKVCIICPEHGEFWQIAHDHMNGCKCPQCAKKSLGEAKIKETLTDMGIKFIHDKASLNFLGRLRPDFYLPDYNLVIEYDGKQHFREFFTISSETLEQRQERDALKNKLCEENGVEILRIPYWDLVHIETILKQKLL